VRRIVEGLLATGISATLVVVAGRNATLLSSLASIRSSPNLDLRVLGYVTYVDDLIVASDLVVTKAGGLIVSEVLARGVPLVVIDPIPGHEEWNADFVVANGAGVQLRIAENAPAAVCHLLRHPQALALMGTFAAAVGRPRAAVEIAERVIFDDTMKRHG
jgi:processive 1,2-diacylglycerol beta-glucosyltransferase